MSFLTQSSSSVFEMWPSPCLAGRYIFDLLGGLASLSPFCKNAGLRVFVAVVSENKHRCRNSRSSKTGVWLVCWLSHSLVGFILRPLTCVTCCLVRHTQHVFFPSINNSEDGEVLLYQLLGCITIPQCPKTHHTLPGCICKRVWRQETWLYLFPSPVSEIDFASVSF